MYAVTKSSFRNFRVNMGKTQKLLTLDRSLGVITGSKGFPTPRLETGKASDRTEENPWDRMWLKRLEKEWRQTQLP